MAIQTVAVIGASGAIGAPITKALLAAGFKVSAITRESSESTFPEGVEVRKADLTSVESLTKAFAGQDAVISAVASSQVGAQIPYVDAALAAHVKRFLPSEFGSDTRPGRLTDPVLATMMGGKAKTLEYLIEKADANPEFTWTGLSTGPFFDFGLDVGVFNVDFKQKKATIVDSGNGPASVSSLDFVGQAVVSLLQHEKETANKYLEVAQFEISQNQLLAILEEITGAKFAVSHTTSDELRKIGHEKLAKGDFSSFLQFLQAYLLSDGDNTVKEADKANKLLGLPEGENVVEYLKEYVKSRSA